MAGRSSDAAVLAAWLCGGWLALAGAVHAQAPGDRAATEDLARRVSERVRALQREADRLAGEARTLVGDLRRLEIERDLALERLKDAEVRVGAAADELKALSVRLAALERMRVESLPDLSARFVELYKRGRGGYARMLAGVRDLRELGRASRAVASLAHVNERRIEEHRRTIASLRKDREAAEQKTRDLAARRADAQGARAAAERAVRARTALIAQIDSRRDLNAQLAGELRVAQEKVQAAVRAAAAGEPIDAVAVPMAPFRGALEWPAAGAVIGRFGEPNRLGAAGVRSGIEIAAPEGTPVRAVHPGTIGFADVFTGYGTLVILDHGAEHYSLYGYLSSVSVERGQRVHAGQELGRTGLAPAGDAALYFEVRIDGRSVDPVQWLRKR